MNAINVLSLSRDGNDWLANSLRPRILHVFERACNLINERREVLSIVTRKTSGKSGTARSTLLYSDFESLSNYSLLFYWFIHVFQHLRRD